MAPIGNTLDPYRTDNIPDHFADNLGTSLALLDVGQDTLTVDQTLNLSSSTLVLLAGNILALFPRFAVLFDVNEDVSSAEHMDSSAI